MLAALSTVVKMLVGLSLMLIAILVAVAIAATTFRVSSLWWLSTFSCLLVLSGVAAIVFVAISNASERIDEGRIAAIDGASTDLLLAGCFWCAMATLLFIITLMFGGFSL
jgi:hypothetical protein